jgi:hypothetical protein
VADQQQESAAMGCLGIILLLVVGSCVFGGSDEKTETPAIEAPATNNKPSPELPIEKNASEVDKTAKAQSESNIEAQPLRGSTILEQAILDAFPAEPPKSAKDRRMSSNAADFVSVTINSRGYLCARPFEARKVSTQLYGVGCLTHNSGYGRSNYLVNIRTGEVEEM